MAGRTISEVITRLNEQAPPGTAESWDNVGLLVGDPAARTTGAVISIDLTEESIRIAKRKGYRLIVNHHPCIYPRSKGLGRVVCGPDSGMSGLVFKAIREGLSVASYHTNFDQCALEVVQKISKGLGVSAAGRLHENRGAELLKIVVFVPLTHLEAVRDAICEAGAGEIGNYDFCTFGVEGQGSFRGGAGTDPFLGKPGILEKAREIRLETVFPRGLQPAVLRALKAAHPYEEVAYDLYEVEQRVPSRGVTRGLGYGFWGEFGSPKPFSEVAKDVRRLFKSSGFLITEPAPRKVRRIGFVAGKGASFMDAAVSAGCDLFITGEAGYHAALDGARRGMAVMELGHRESEFFFLSTMKEWISAAGLQSAEVNLPTQKIMP